MSSNKYYATIPTSREDSVCIFLMGNEEKLYEEF